MTRATLTHGRYTVEQYLRAEQTSETKHEFRDGELIDMSGGSLEHSEIVVNLIRELSNRLLNSPCRVHESNARVRIAKQFRYVYPDISVLCGRPEFDPLDSSRQTVTNPKVVFEVLSPTTEATDRGEKMRRYLEIPSLQEYVIVSQNSARVETFFRQEDGAWRFTYVDGIESTARLRSLEIEIPMSAVYTGIEFPPEEQLTEL